MLLDFVFFLFCVFLFFVFCVFFVFRFRKDEFLCFLWFFCDRIQESNQDEADAHVVRVVNHIQLLLFQQVAAEEVAAALKHAQTSASTSSEQQPHAGGGGKKRKDTTVATKRVHAKFIKKVFVGVACLI